MKLIRIYICLPILFMLAACGKNNTPATSSSTTTTTPTNPPPTGTTCTAQLSDAENISIFPADNAWNQDISSAAIDPYNTQIIAQISASKIHSDFGSGL